MDTIVKIVIPVYKPYLSEDEILSLKRCFEVLKNYKISFVAPEKMSFKFYDEIVGEGKYELISVPEMYMSSIDGYNSLMLSTFFYEKFIGTRYILIYQLDAYIFEDNLLAWCNKNYDYVGAPWVNWEWSSFYARHLTFIRRQLYKFGYNKFNLVGNGGLSLRKVDSCINNLKIFKRQAAKFTKNEDFFFSFFITSYNPFFKIPPIKEALKFAFDENPEQAFALNNNQLPMGCHAWPKYRNFWQQYI
jgi:hypothetical protein